MRSEGRIEAAIRSALSDTLGGARIVSVQAEQAVDSDGEDILNVTVVIDAASKIDPAGLAGVVRRIRPKLDELGERRFPMLSFLTEADARKLGLEAA